MPVDRFGKLFFHNNPASKYATPINRKPKRKKLFEHYLLPGFVLSLITILVIAFIAAFAVTLTKSSTSATPKTLWYESFIHEGAGSTEVGPVNVTGTWHFTWQCPVTNNAMSMSVLAQGNPLLLKNVECTSNDHKGFATVTYTGQVYINISAVGSWTLSIEESTQ